MTTLLAFFRKILRRLGMILFPSAFKTMSVSVKSSNTEVTVVETTGSIHTLDSLKEEVMRLFRYPCTMRRMVAMSAALRIQYKAKLQESEACMLPSYCHALPNGKETGTYISLDVGGSTLRIALVELHGREAQNPMAIKTMASFKIDEQIRRLPGTEFFDWMASRIQVTLEERKDTWSPDETLPLGLAWSFPIEQTSHRGGKVQGMGKGFACAETTLGMDLGELIEAACARKRLNVRVEAIVNDSSATLLSQAYLDPATSLALILGTGTNAAAYLPTASMGKAKFGVREQSWFDKADRVITNTEVSMFGKSILLETRWDELLNRQHQRPDFQPLEYMTTGRYLGELMRLIVVEAVETGELFDGVIPDALRENYSLDTEIMAKLEMDTTKSMKNSIAMIKKAFGLKKTPSLKEVAFLRAAAESISYRASAYMAVAVHGLWALQKDSDINPTTPHGTPKTSIACNGSVILKYPGFKDRCEGFIRQMIEAAALPGGTSSAEKVVLEPTNEAAIFGAAVAVALADAP
ncbi:N-acetylglucosamine kinase 1 [Cladophialophora chaetospira]|uniref:Phosphotransferase n=1 Tax=Cladophialophora chaetospira TaxID=386627 RepID=A0AA39CI96_9EURO|nr:N-acetylglucosamine kinase 1 [Cladophialophora chaetospira]